MRKKYLYSGLALLGSLVSFGIYFTERITHIKKKEEQEIIERDMQLKHIHPATFSELPKKEVWIPSPHGYQISTMMINPYPSKRYVIFSHGVTESKMSSIKYANLFLKRGFNVVIYDQRRHGQTGGKTTSYGYYEKDDLQAVVHWLYAQVGQDLLLGIHGESMGAATALLYAGDKGSRAHFYVVDCPFSDLKELLRYRMKCEIKYLPASIFVPLGNVFLRFRDGYSMKQVSPISVVDQIDQPVLFIHSEKDDYILPYMTKDLYDKKRGDKMLLMAKNGTHAQSLNENQTEYEAAIDEFLQKYVM
ncbi:alpha/beta hydrolase [Caldibacillus lycopersici]|uniref:Alpha/beta hydrolase n=1 Tax=Perspicuibacillus lycopersici TaxID=1325689 RepID=A0AAE3LMN7_9BACI|nr:alpha/beta hydrolase [Perspicuibacillus lycopersici]MCU9613780.1 alpha/beta hydrolase [Perspicuibacillus lycopersici]